MNQYFYQLIAFLRRIIGIDKLYDLTFHKEFRKRIKDHKNPINNQSYLNGFSQNEEDSITLNILDRLKLKNGFFVEFGVGKGLENNSLILLASGWKGAWFGNENLLFDTLNSERLSFMKTWITKENIAEIFFSIKNNVDVISIDLDGNDYFLVEELLSKNIHPSLFIIEYNAKFPFQIDFKIQYDSSHNWKSDDYFGASLNSFNNLFMKYNYRLICCNITGASAFFVKNSYSKLFEDIPKDLLDLYSEPFYFLRSKKMHPTSIKTIKKIIE